jgi:hypothetical protein
MKHWFVWFFFSVVLFGSMPILAASSPTSTKTPSSGTTLGYEQRTIQEEAAAFFGEASEGLAKALEEAFKIRGKPNAYIKGEEVAVAFSFGVRYGNGVMRTYGSDNGYKLFWQGPSIGFDQGLNCSKVFILVYNLPEANSIFRGFPGVETSLYYYAGISATYLEASDVVLIPIRTGMGLRTGINLGYIRFSRAPSWNPF